MWKCCFFFLLLFVFLQILFIIFNFGLYTGKIEPFCSAQCDNFFVFVFEMHQNINSGKQRQLGLMIAHWMKNHDNKLPQCKRICFWLFNVYQIAAMKLCKLQHGNDESKTKRFGFVRERGRVRAHFCLCTLVFAASVLVWTILAISFW